MLRNTQRHNVTSSYFYSINCIVNSVTADGCVHITESVGSRRELVANSCTHRRRRRDATRQFCRVGVGCVHVLGLMQCNSMSTTEAVPSPMFPARSKKIAGLFVSFISIVTGV